MKREFYGQILKIKPINKFHMIGTKTLEESDLNDIINNPDLYIWKYPSFEKRELLYMDVLDVVLKIGDKIKISEFECEIIDKVYDFSENKFIYYTDYTINTFPLNESEYEETKTNLIKNATKLLEQKIKVNKKKRFLWW